MSLDFYINKSASNYCECCGQEIEDVYSRNITHNLAKMASEAGIYCVLWHPNENGYQKTDDIIDLLSNGLDRLKSDPDHYRQFDAPNGWGVYQHFVLFVEDVLKNCIEYKGYYVRTST